MAKKNKQQQKRRQQAKARKNQKRAKLAQSRRAGSDLTQIGRWPIEAAFLSDVADPRFAQAVLARRRPDGALSIASFLLDLKCLGVKDAVFWPKSDDERLLTLLDRAESMLPMSECAPEDVMKAVGVALDYAASLGLGAHPDYQKAARVFEGLDADASTIEVPTGGPDGRPHFVSGPYDDVEGILATLAERLGADGFDFTDVSDLAELLPEE